jgi:adenylate cyclase
MATSETSQRTKPRRRRSAHDGLPRARRRSTAELLLEVSNTLASIDVLDQQLETLIEMTRKATQAERGTLFLNDPLTGELYSRVGQGNSKREIRILNTTGVAGHVFQTGEPVLTNDPTSHPAFNPKIDESTGFRTRNMLCVPINTLRGQRIGVAQALNREGDFTADGLALFGAMITHASTVLQSTLFVEKMERARRQEGEFLRVVSDVSSEIQLGPLLQKIMAAVTRMLNCERSTLFLNDEKTRELYTEIGQGLGVSKIRLPNHIGIAGTVFTTGQTVNIPYAYADLRFSPAFDKQTNFFTRSILCVPVTNKDGKTIGVTQILNKHGGFFSDDDEARLKAFTAQISIALENAKLFDDVQTTKNYNESILESMSNGVLTISEDGRCVTCNAAGFRILKVAPSDVIGRSVKDLFSGSSAWIVEMIDQAHESGTSAIIIDKEMESGPEKLSVNLTVNPLVSANKSMLGSMVLIEDISNEKRVKSTMARYMDPSVADKLLGSGEELLGGVSSESTVLFSDIRGFTTITEELGAQGTVALLNDYFSVMVECIQREGGMLDKFIGDAIMAIFGIPIAHEDDPDRAVRAAIRMLVDLRKFNEHRLAHGQRPIDMGVGINTGMIVSGNIGSPKRMDYTVIGDGVNLASRLESACKQYAAHILVSEFTARKLRATYRLREVDFVVVKGKTEPVGVFEVLDFHTPDSFPNLMEVLNDFKYGLELYRSAKWRPAISAFQKALSNNPQDRLSQVYIDRCQYYEENPPGAGWDRVWTMTSK